MYKCHAPGKAPASLVGASDIAGASLYGCMKANWACEGTENLGGAAAT